MQLLTTPQQLSIISKAWGRTQSGYCFFPYIDGDCRDKSERIASYHEGPAFLWPKDKKKILAHMEKHKNDDLYWCPMLFARDRRNVDEAMDEHALWADLDRVNPRDIKDYPPTVAWETSPKSYQALWLLSSGDLQGAAWPGRENQALTYHLEADPSGWDATQLLRIPGWKNHKPEYKEEHGGPVQGKLLWKNKRAYLPDEFTDLPEVPNVQVVSDFVEEQLGHVDRHEVWGRVRLKVSKRVRELMGAREASGDRSDVLWEIERDLADAGCSIAEIVKVVQTTVWNKYEGRADELRRLTTEAAKAVSQRPDEVVERLEEEANRPDPTPLFELLKNIPPPKWLIRDVLTTGAVGFIAGQPKSFKSWMALDMALSVASGQLFLGEFPILDPGPVLYIQEEDSAVTLRQRVNKIWPSKHIDRMSVSSNGGIEWAPAQEVGEAPPIDGYIMEGLVLSDPGWQAWLHDQLHEREYRLLVIDPLMMTAGDVEENRAQEMTNKVFRPLKELARSSGCAIQVVHHMRKGGGMKGGEQRGGQLMLGSVANHAWAEDSLYVTHGRAGDMIVEQESKYAPVPGFKVSHIRNKKWEPQILVNRMDLDEEYIDPVTQAEPKKRLPKIVQVLQSMPDGAYATKSIAEFAGITQNAAWKQLTRAEANDLITKKGQQWQLT